MTLRFSNIGSIRIERARVDVEREGVGSAPGYRYIITDLLTDEIVAEVPFMGVSFTRMLVRAGGFSGSIPVIEATDHLNLYDATMPGKRALYVLRGDTCVWGGIIWSRSYNAKSRELTVDASEFISYLYHRIHWQTSIYPTTVDTYEVVRDMLNKLANDFHGFDYDNEIIAPDKISHYSVVEYERSSNVATLRTLEPHGLFPGQGVIAKGVNDTIDGPFIAETIISDNAFSGSSTGTDLPLTLPGAIRIQDVIAYSIGANYTSGGVLPVPGSGGLIAQDAALPWIATIWVTEPHGLSPGDIIDVDVSTRGGAFLSGVKTIDFVPSSTMIQYYIDSTSIVTSNIIVNALSVTPPNGTVMYGPRIAVSSYGPYTFNSDIGIVAESLDLAGTDQTEQVWRGSQLKTFGDLLEDFSNNENGFEYRIDPYYDPATNMFSKTFVFVQREPPPAPAEGESPLERFDAQDLIFEFPGSILEISMDESAEAAATRMWVVGNDPYIGADASQPYAAVSDLSLYADGWPIIDQQESERDEFSEEKLREKAQEYLYEARPPIADIKITVNGSVYPIVGSFYPGEWCGIVIEEDKFLLQRLAHPLEPRSDVLIRKINGFTVRVPDAASYPEIIDLELIEDWKLDNVNAS